MDARQGRRGKRISLQQEKQAAAALGGKTMAASGATRLGGGGDVRVMGNTRIECKFTEKPSYTLHYLDLKKLRQQAMKVLERPVFQFAFRHPSGKMKSYAVVFWSFEDVPKPADHILFTTFSSVGFTENQLDTALHSGRIQFTFHCHERDPLLFRIFEIMSWDKYVETEVSDAGTQHDSSIPGTTDASKR